MAKLVKIMTLLVLIFAFLGVAMADTQQGKKSEDDITAQLIAVTLEQGASRLSGRYSHVKMLPSRAGDGELMAATSIIMTIGAKNEDGTYDASFNVPNAEDLKFKVELDLSGEIPILKMIYPDGKIQSNQAVLLPHGQNYPWRLVGVESKNLSQIIPLTSDWFPANYLEGNWKGNDETTISFNSGKIIFNGETSGTYTVTDNRISVKMEDGNSDLIFAAYEPETGVLVLTFNGANQENWNAMAYRKVNVQTPQVSQPQNPQNQQPQAPQYPQNPQQQVPQAPQYPQNQQPQIPQYPQYPQAPQFPQMPQTNPLQFLINGVWGTYLNGSQIITQIQGNQCWDWVNGQPAGHGTFQLQGNIMYVYTDNGQMLQNIINIDPSGRTMSIQYQNGFTLVFQRMQ